MQRTLLEHYAPACVVSNAQGEAVHFSGRTGRYLELPPGTPNMHLLSMAREGLRPTLRAAMHQAVTRHQRVVYEQVPVQTNGGVQPITLVVEPLTEPGADALLYLVLFQDAAPAAPPAPPAAATPGPEDGPLQHLEHELRATREHLQTLIEELETSNEELSSANEELQSTNEELETSKEELQSLNEELETLNAELRRKVEDLDRSNSDLQVDLLAEALQDPAPESPTQVAESLAEIRTNLARVDDLVQDYLALVRAGASELTVQDLGAAMQAWSAEFQALAAAHGVTLQVDGLATLGPVAFHANTLRRAVLNLVQKRSMRCLGVAPSSWWATVPPPTPSSRYRIPAAA